MAEFLRRGAASLAAWWLRPAAPHAIPVSIHVLIWTLLLAVNLLRLAGRRLMDGGANWSWPLMLADLVLTVVTYAGLFYFTWRVLVPRHLDRQKPLRFLLVLLLAVAATGLIRWVSNAALGVMPAEAHGETAATEYPLAPPTTHPDNSVTGSFMDGLRAGYREGARQQRGGQTNGKNILPASLLVMLLGIYLRLGHDHQHEQRRRKAAEQLRKEAERQHLAAELGMLKAQINPHFLFNTLNNIYSLASEQDPEAPAATAVLQLSDLMRYLLYESAADTVPLAKEVEHLRNFLNLHLLRLPGAGPERLHFEVAPELEFSTFPVAPMLLQPLVENAFKHGDLTARPHAVELQLAVVDGQLEFTVRNRRRDPRPGPPQPGGVGLPNLRRRLQLLYPGRYALHVHETAEYYTVTMILVPATAPAPVAA
jgi:signal transduction histidine kinase